MKAVFQNVGGETYSPWADRSPVTAPKTRRLRLGHSAGEYNANMAITENCVLRRTAGARLQRWKQNYSVTWGHDCRYWCRKPPINRQIILHGDISILINFKSLYGEFSLCPFYCEQKNVTKRLRRLRMSFIRENATALRMRHPGNAIGRHPRCIKPGVSIELDVLVCPHICPFNPLPVLDSCLHVLFPPHRQTSSCFQVSSLCWLCTGPSRQVFLLALIRHPNAARSIPPASPASINEWREEPVKTK